MENIILGKYAHKKNALGRYAQRTVNADQINAANLSTDSILLTNGSLYIENSGISHRSQSGREEKIDSKQLDHINSFSKDMQSFFEANKNTTMQSLTQAIGDISKFLEVVSEDSIFSRDGIYPLGASKDVVQNYLDNQLITELQLNVTTIDSNGQENEIKIQHTVQNMSVLQVTPGHFYNNFLRIVSVGPGAELDVEWSSLTIKEVESGFKTYYTFMIRDPDILSSSDKIGINMYPFITNEWSLSDGTLNIESTIPLQYLNRYKANSQSNARFKIKDTDDYATAKKKTLTERLEDVENGLLATSVLQSETIEQELDVDMNTVAFENIRDQFIAEMIAKSGGAIENVEILNIVEV